MLITLILTIFSFIVMSYLALCLVLYFWQEKFIFAPEKLSPNRAFSFTQTYKELKVKTSDNIDLHAILFETNKPKRGLIFYLHGKKGSIANTHKLSQLYLDNQYDFFALDYRSYGKSEGKITNEQQLYSDVQNAYDFIKQSCDEKDIIILGYSLGCAFACQIAANNQPKQLILISPFYNLSRIQSKRFPYVPHFLLRYRFPNNEFIQLCTMPIIIFHGDADKVISCQSSNDLKTLLKPHDQLIILQNQEHHKIYDNREYQNAIHKLLQSQQPKTLRNSV